MSKLILDNKGRVIGREVNDNLLDGNGRMVGRFIKSSNITVNDKGENKGRGDQRQRLLDK